MTATTRAAGLTQVGIDLGTSKCVAAVGAAVQPLPPQGGNLLPSAVAFPPNRVTLVGKDARRRRPIDPKNTIVSSKRLIGRRWRSPDVEEFRRLYPVELVRTDDDAAAFRTRSGVVTPIEVAAILLSSLARQAALDAPASTAVIAVPVVFSARERAATLEAARRVGFGGVGLIDEPLATLHAHLHAGRHRPGLAAVYDFGGGTFDVAIVDCSVQPVKILGFGGDLYLGGDDLDRALAQWAAAEVLRAHHWDLADDTAVFARLETECERVKILLSTEERAEIELSQVDPGSAAAASSVLVTRDLLEELSLALVQRSFIVCDQVLHEAGVKTRDLDAVFYAGGTMRLPMVRQAVGLYFGQPLVCDFDPTEVVAIGAGVSSVG